MPTGDKRHQRSSEMDYLYLMAEVPFMQASRDMGIPQVQNQPSYNHLSFCLCYGLSGKTSSLICQAEYASGLYE
jgi:hypothetical protein